MKKIISSMINSYSSALSDPVPSGPVNHLSSGSIPAGFDINGFLHHAKMNFKRLQAANDAKNLKEIRDFTTSEVYTEIELQMKERDDNPQHTEVVTLNAELLEVTSDSECHNASIRFSGELREAPDAPTEGFDEIWHLQKSINGATGWLVAGIEQVE